MRATGIGSLPFRSLEKARALLARFELPFLPELPNLERDDLMLRRPFAGLLEADEPRLRADIDRDAPVILGPGIALLEATTAPEVKVQIAGPRALGAWVADARGKPLASDERTFVRQRVGLVVQALMARLFGRRVIVFFDEPGLEAPSPELTESIERARAAGAHKVGVHDCGRGFRHAIASRPDFLSFDLSFFSLDAEIEEFVKGGGALAVGAVPTTSTFDRNRVRAKLSELAPWLEGALVTPACGMALLDDDSAERIHQQALELA